MSEAGAPSATSSWRGQTIRLVAALLVLFGVLGVLGYRLIARDALATLTALQGSAERDTARQMHAWRATAEGDEFEIGDGARTEEGASARFQLRGGAKLVLNPASQIRFQKSDKGRLSIGVELGSALIESGATALAISSEFGELVLDAGGALRLEREDGRLRVEVELGQVQLANQALQAGQGLTLEFGGVVFDPKSNASAEPSPPTPAPVDTAEAARRFERGAGVATAELSVRPGESFVVHDPHPPTAIGFTVDELCPAGAQLQAGEQVTEGTGQLNLRFGKGSHSYQLRCVDAPDKVVAKGNVRVLEDAGTRSLSTFTPSAEIVTDGRRYTVLYQHRLPKVTVSWPTAPQAASYDLQVGSRTVRTTRPSYTFNGLSRGSHQVTFSADTKPARRSRTTTIEVVYDTQAPAARLSEPSVGLGTSNAGVLTGQALPGWNVSVDNRPISVDAQQRFSVELEGRAALPIALTHPKLGTHYYIRRSAQEGHE